MRKITIKEKDYLDLVQKEKDLEQYFQESIRLGQENTALQTSDRVFPDLSDSLGAYVTAQRFKHELQAGSHMFPVISTKTMHLPNGEVKLAAVVLLPKDFFTPPNMAVEEIIGYAPTNDTQGADDPDDIKDLFHPAQ